MFKKYSLITFFVFLFLFESAIAIGAGSTSINSNGIDLIQVNSGSSLPIDSDINSGSSATIDEDSVDEEQGSQVDGYSNDDTFVDDKLDEDEAFNKSMDEPYLSDDKFAKNIDENYVEGQSSADIADDIQESDADMLDNNEDSTIGSNVNDKSAYVIGDAAKDGYNNKNTDIFSPIAKSDDNSYDDNNFLIKDVTFVSATKDEEGRSFKDCLVLKKYSDGTWETYCQPPKKPETCSQKDWDELATLAVLTC